MSDEELIKIAAWIPKFSDRQIADAVILQAAVAKVLDCKPETDEERKARLEEMERVKREKAHINMHEFSVARRMSERECLEQLVSLGPPTDADGGWNECCARLSEYSDTLTEKEHLFLNHNVDCPYLQAWLMIGMESK